MHVPGAGTRDEPLRTSAWEVKLPQDCLGTPTWPPFHCFGTLIWPSWRHVKTLYICELGLMFTLASKCWKRTRWQMAPQAPLRKPANHYRLSLGCHLSKSKLSMVVLSLTSDGSPSWTLSLSKPKLARTSDVIYDLLGLKLKWSLLKFIVCM